MKAAMQNCFAVGLALSVLVLMSPGVSQAADVTVGTDVSTAYVWRGVTFNDEGAIQPSVDISHESGVGLNIWGNFDIGNFNNTLESGEFSEIDLTLSYAVPIEEFDFSVGVIHYTFPQGGASTTELYGSIGSTLYGPISGALDFYYDVDEVSDLYANTSITIDLTNIGFDMGSEKFGMEVMGSLGFAGDVFASSYGGGSDSGIFDWNINTSLSYAWTETVEITGFINYTDNADSDVLSDQPTDIYGGVGIYYSF